MRPYRSGTSSGSARRALADRAGRSGRGARRRRRREPARCAGSATRAAAPRALRSSRVRCSTWSVGRRRDGRSGGARRTAPESSELRVLGLRSLGQRRPDGARQGSGPCSVSRPTPTRTAPGPGRPPASPCSAATRASCVSYVATATTPGCASAAPMCSAVNGGSTPETFVAARSVWSENRTTVDPGLDVPCAHPGPRPRPAARAGAAR